MEGGWRTDMLVEFCEHLSVWRDVLYDALMDYMFNDSLDQQAPFFHDHVGITCVIRETCKVGRWPRINDLVTLQSEHIESALALSAVVVHTASAFFRCDHFAHVLQAKVALCD
jgi:hypothetical protein